MHRPSWSCPSCRQSVLWFVYFWVLFGVVRLLLWVVWGL